LVLVLVFVLVLSDEGTEGTLLTTGGPAGTLLTGGPAGTLLTTGGTDTDTIGVEAGGAGGAGGAGVPVGAWI